MSGLLSRLYFRPHGKTCLDVLRLRAQVGIGVGNQTQSQTPGFKIIRLMSSDPKRKIGAGAYALLILPITCFGLGYWQVRRWDWKLNLIADLDDKIHRPPVPLPDDLRDLTKKENEFLRVKFRGKYDHSKEIHITNRRDLANEMARDMGVYVVTPLTLSDRPQSILVNRGHVPFKKELPEKRKKGQVEGEVEIVGFNRFDESLPPFAYNDIENRMFYNRDLNVMSEMTGSVPIFIESDVATSTQGGPIGGQTRVHIRNQHMEYILTWFGLAFLLSFIWYKLYFNPTKIQSVLGKSGKTLQKGFTTKK